MKLRVALLALILVIGFIVLTNRGGRILDRIPALQNDAKIFTPADTARTASLSSDELNNIDIYKRARHATVHITSTVYRRNWFLEVYPARDIGSGFVIDDQGHILTNSHVLLGGGRIQVTLENKDLYDAEILARDRRNDLGLIKINPKKKLSFLQLSDSENLQVGQKVLAIGNPFGLEGTLTTGIISSIGRTIQDEQGMRLEGMIQTDAAINPGNSGGPLLDSFGNVIGINTAIYGAQGNIGIGFAMPINRARAMLDDYRAGRSFKRPRLGVVVEYVAGDLAQALDLPAQGGLLIQDVAKGSAAEAAGIRGPRQVVIIGNIELGVGGDLIMAIDGRQADRIDAIPRALANKRPGDRVQLTLFRGGRTVNVPITLGEDPNDL